jgi:hypothetical protein
MTMPPPGVPQAGDLKLSAWEERLVRTLRLLAEIEPSAPAQVEEFVWSLVARSLKWSYSDPASIARAVSFMQLDPFLKREVEAINEDFASALGDGLEDY